MKKIISCLTLMALSTSLAMAQDPIVSTKYTADPAPYVHGDTIYLYTTHDEDDAEGFIGFFHEKKEYLNSARPTAVNLSWALNRMEKVCLENKDKGVAKICELLKEEAVKIKAEDTDMCYRIGENALSLLKKNLSL